MSVTAYIALGSNLDERAAHLRQALALLAERPDMHVTRVSSFYETDPVGGPPGQPRFVNAAAEVSTTLSAPDLLRLYWTWKTSWAGCAWRRTARAPWTWICCSMAKKSSRSMSPLCNYACLTRACTSVFLSWSHWPKSRRR